MSDTTMSTQPGETYLYDGVYVSYDGFQFCLRAPRENGNDHFVYLEPHAIKLFLEFVEQQKKYSREGQHKFS